MKGSRMMGLEKKSFNAPDERRMPPNTTMETVRFGDRAVARITYQPGWRWTSDIKPVVGTDLCDIKPVVGTDLCDINHFVYVLSGRTHVATADGREMDIGAGDVAVIPAGHNAWVVGDEPCVFLDFGGAVRPE